ncbi:hypothetical protein DPMN_125991 [Dreissena polymorpha]|uniref:Uncharacterized protein n=1 Tax=Dreissena polymorpha TaxID=45954 RepID=A0A9D4GUX0_DREPO|nr:hypothetical protein DPMN_125991 [Dreissena polymorpha]
MPVAFRQNVGLLIYRSYTGTLTAFTYDAVPVVHGAVPVVHGAVPVVPGAAPVVADPSR